MHKYSMSSAHTVLTSLSSHELQPYLSHLQVKPVSAARGHQGSCSVCVSELVMWDAQGGDGAFSVCCKHHRHTSDMT